MSIAEIHDLRVPERPLVPPQPPRAPDNMGFWERMRMMRVS